MLFQKGCLTYLQNYYDSRYGYLQIVQVIEVCLACLIPWYSLPFSLILGLPMFFEQIFDHISNTAVESQFYLLRMVLVYVFRDTYIERQGTKDSTRHFVL